MTAAFAIPVVLGDMGALEDRIQRNLLAFMKERGLTTPELHFLSGIPVGTLQKYMNGQRTPKVAPLNALAEALGRPAGDFYLESPPPGKAYKKPAFGLRILDESVDADLLKRAQGAMDELNMAHAAKVAQRESRKPTRTYVTDLDEANAPELPGRLARRINAGSLESRVDGQGEGHAERGSPVPLSRRVRTQTPRPKR